MSEPIVETAGPEFAAAFEANFADFFTTFGLMPGGEVHRDDGITWFASGFPLDLINGVVQTRLPEDLGPERVRERCEAVLARLAARAVPALWWLTPLSRPLDLAAHLPDAMKKYHLARDVGHYGIFNGSKWRERIAPVVEEWIAAHARK